MADRADEQLSADERSLVETEQQLWASVRTALRTAASDRSGLRHQRADLEALRDTAASAHSGDLPGLLDALHREQSRVRMAAALELPDPDAPYFAHLVLRGPRGPRDVFIGYRTFVEPRQRVTIVDWRHAPIARVFFTYDEGEAYEEELNGREVSGVLEARRVLAFEGGELVQILAPGLALRCDPDGVWRRERSAAGPTLAGAEGGRLADRLLGTGQAGAPRPVVSALLDEAQYEAMETAADGPLLVLGSAGCGKTTVALHRLASLCYRDPERFAPQRTLAVVPEPGLARLTRTLLDELGQTETIVTTFDRWVVSQARRILVDLPQRLRVDAPTAIVRFKRHQSLLAQLKPFVDWQGEETARRLDHLLVGRGEVAEQLHRAEGRDLLSRLDVVEAELGGQGSVMWQREVHGAFEAERAGLYRVKEDLALLLGSRDWLQQAVDQSAGQLNPELVEDVLQRTRAQLRETSDEIYAHVDPARLEPIDGRALDESTPDEVAASCDLEDLPLMLELLRLKTGAVRSPRGELATYAHLVLDEAQEYAPPELALLAAALDQGTSVTVAGDEMQLVDPASCFTSWEQTLAALGATDAKPVTLTTSYRCPRPIALLGHQVLGPLAPAQTPNSSRDGAPVSRTLVPSEGHVAAVLAQEVRALLDREPRANLAIITHRAESAQALHAALEHGMPLRLVTAGDFSFRPGVDVTHAALVKGLEFDYVVIPDATPVNYPDTAEARRLLHVAVTRAVHQLWLLAAGAWSPVLPAAD